MLEKHLEHRVRTAQATGGAAAATEEIAAIDREDWSVLLPPPRSESDSDSDSDSDSSGSGSGSDSEDENQEEPPRDRSTLHADEAFQTAPESRAQAEYDRFMGMSSQRERAGALDSLRHRVKCGTYWADEAYQVAVEGQRQAEYDRLMALPEAQREHAFNELSECVNHTQPEPGALAERTQPNVRVDFPCFQSLQDASNEDWAFMLYHGQVSLEFFHSIGAISNARKEAIQALSRVMKKDRLEVQFFEKHKGAMNKPDPAHYSGIIRAMETADQSILALFAVTSDMVDEWAAMQTNSKDVHM